MDAPIRQKTTVERAVELAEAGMGRDFHLIVSQLLEEGYEDASAVINDPDIRAGLIDLHGQAIHPAYLDVVHQLAASSSSRRANVSSRAPRHGGR